MVAGSNCNCLICRLEKWLVSELERECVPAELLVVPDRGRASECSARAIDLVDALHSSGSLCADRLLAGLLQASTRPAARSFCQRLLLLAFIPTIHRTATHVRVSFPFLAKEDISQHVIALFWESLWSGEILRLTSHVAFTIARLLRRRAFRWAIRESRLALPEEPVSLAQESEEARPLGAETILGRFLDHCQRAGWLSSEERHLLTESRLEGTSYRELARENGHSPVAIRHRVQRIVDRLKKIAEKAPPHQFELFPDARVLSTRKKYFDSTRSISIFADRLVV